MSLKRGKKQEAVLEITSCLCYHLLSFPVLVNCSQRHEDHSVTEAWIECSHRNLVQIRESQMVYCGTHKGKKISVLHSLSTSVWKAITNALDFKQSDLTVLVKSLGQSGYSITDQITIHYTFFLCLHGLLLPRFLCQAVSQ